MIEPELNRFEKQPIIKGIDPADVDDPITINMVDADPFLGELVGIIVLVGVIF